ncbi:nerve growth factor receptor b [Pungitius pungitius]|uniref:nerve growth factor receptor b n=1 Tax=Pungitius pungitius TaxID=134920 RepID=UPI0018886FBA|nr:nerve growth factor receptor b [Pungitius pungitius]
MTRRMNYALALVLLGVVHAAAKKEDCLSGRYTNGGECCERCPPGEGVIQPCGVSQTVCAPCLDSETFSESFSATERCQPCTVCAGLFRMKEPCTDSNDASCICNYDFYMNELSGRCERCTKCPEGEGMLLPCDSDQDTTCEECTGDNYSDQESSREPCLPCSTCDEEGVSEICTSVTDTVCQVPPFYDDMFPTPFSGNFTPTNEVYLPETPPSEEPRDTSTTTTNGDSKEPIYHLNNKLIPIYCSILAAVVVGLVAFFIFKRWNSCKQNKQAANNCTANQNQTPSPEGEKLHSDSGISVDSQSLQEQQGQTQAQTVVTMDEEPCLLLPLQTREKVEKLLFSDCTHTEDSDWCNLAGLLGYKDERIATFQQEEHPVRALLRDWASKDCASVDALCAALRKINREDVAQSLAPSPSATRADATSVV